MVARAPADVQPWGCEREETVIVVDDTEVEGMQVEMARVTREVELPATADEVWSALTRPEELAEWFGAEVELELSPGSPARWRGDGGELWHGVVEEVEPGRRLAYRWWPEDAGPDAATRVELTVDPDDDHSVLRVVETGPITAAAWTALGSSASWQSRLGGIQACAAGHTAPLALARCG
jgi:uncharacterized protein YndB with AHSA1/START domain